MKTRHREASQSKSLSINPEKDTPKVRDFHLVLRFLVNKSIVFMSLRGSIHAKLGHISCRSLRPTKRVPCLKRGCISTHCACVRDNLYAFLMHVQSTQGFLILPHCGLTLLLFTPFRHVCLHVHVSSLYRDA